VVAVVAVKLLNGISIPVDVGFRPNLEINPRVLLFTLGVTLWPDSSSDLPPRSGDAAVAGAGTQG
jgi:hypothetical protein